MNRYISLKYFENIGRSYREAAQRVLGQDEEEEEEDGDFSQLLPPEVCNELFSYLPPRDIYSASQVCWNWRDVINNSMQWQDRCIQLGWATKSTPHTFWSKVESHVSDEQLFQYRGNKKSPKFRMTPLASDGLEPLCHWAMFYRQRSHLEVNWRTGNHVIHQMDFPEDLICNTASCDGRLLIIGTVYGYVMIWSVLGVPKLLKIIPSIQRDIEVEIVKVTQKRLIILYQIGLLRIYDIEEMSRQAGEICHCTEMRILTESWVWGKSIGEHEFTIKVREATPTELNTTQIDNVRLWINELFHGEAPWVNADYLTSDLMISASEKYLIISGLACNTLCLWDFESGGLAKRLILPPGTQVCHKVASSAKTVYFSGRRATGGGGGGRFVPEASVLFTYSLKEPLGDEIGEIPCRQIAEEIKVEEGDERLLYVTPESDISAYDLVSKKPLFFRSTNSHLDNIVINKELILYHQYSGYLTAINWGGENLYQIIAHMGFIRGLKIHNEFIISGGDCRQVTIWDVKTGSKCHTVFNHPSHIGNLFVYDTKIITVGRIDPPCLIGYW